MESYKMMRVLPEYEKVTIKPRSSFEDINEYVSYLRQTVAVLDDELYRVTSMQRVDAEQYNRMVQFYEDALYLSIDEFRKKYPVDENPEWMSA